jgi:hypothetical protein
MLPAMLDFSSFAESGASVGVEGERENVLAKGPRCVSFSSVERVSYNGFIKLIEVFGKIVPHVAQSPAFQADHSIPMIIAARKQ